MTKREIVSIAIGDASNGLDLLYALCNDGTIWRIPVFDLASGWERWTVMPAIPQGD